MDIQNAAIDQDFSVEKIQDASTGKRFLNYLIDLLTYYLITFLLGFFAAIIGFAEEVQNPMFNIVVFLIWMIYYILMEGNGGKTLGKMLTKTKVIDENGNTPGMRTAFLRTISRIVPFEFLSIFFGNEQRMWHDKWTGTRVVNSN